MLVAGREFEGVERWWGSASDKAKALRTED
jgi:hypothetical protein